MRKEKSVKRKRNTHLNEPKNYVAQNMLPISEDEFLRENVATESLIKNRNNENVNADLIQVEVKKSLHQWKTRNTVLQKK